MSIMSFMVSEKRQNLNTHLLYSMKITKTNIFGNRCRYTSIIEGASYSASVTIEINTPIWNEADV